MDSPLVSFVLIAYNQEQFVGQAVSSALAQTYSPLEIILSDDCSPDRTFAIMEQMAAAYKGPHRIVLNRNPRNLGLVAHVNKVFALCHGELVVVAAGDDISVPERTSTIVTAWDEGGRGTAVLYSQVQPMARDGSLVSKDVQIVLQQDSRAHVLLREWGGNITGASCAFTMSLWRTFGALRADMPCEDIPLTWRGALCGRLQFLPQPLVLWRISGASEIWLATNCTPQEKQQILLKWVRERHQLSFQACQDVESYEGAGRREKHAAWRFKAESGFVLEGMEAGLPGFCWACVRSLFVVGWHSGMMRMVIRRRFRHWFEAGRDSRSAGWRSFFRCYDFLRRHGMASP